MRFIMPLAIATVFIIYGIYSIIYPSKIKDSMNRSHKEGLTDFGASDEYAEKYVKKYVAQADWIYRFFGIVSLVGGSLLFYAVVRTFLKP